MKTSPSRRQGSKSPEPKPNVPDDVDAYEIDVNRTFGDQKRADNSDSQFRKQEPGINVFQREESPDEQSTPEMGGEKKTSPMFTFDKMAEIQARAIARAKEEARKEEYENDQAQIIHQ